jgi:hypothetical protein
VQVVPRKSLGGQSRQDPRAGAAKPPVGVKKVQAAAGRPPAWYISCQGTPRLLGVDLGGNRGAKCKSQHSSTASSIRDSIRGKVV